MQQMHSHDRHTPTDGVCPHPMLVLLLFDCVAVDGCVCAWRRKACCVYCRLIRITCTREQRNAILKCHAGNFLPNLEYCISTYSSHCYYSRAFESFASSPVTSYISWATSVTSLRKRTSWYRGDLCDKLVAFLFGSRNVQREYWWRCLASGDVQKCFKYVAASDDRSIQWLYHSFCAGRCLRPAVNNKYDGRVFHPSSLVLSTGQMLPSRFATFGTYIACNKFVVHYVLINAR